MKYEMKRPTTEEEAVSIITQALLVVHGQIDYYRGDSKRSWNGEFVDHCRNEAMHSLSWLADRYTAPSGQSAPTLNEKSPLDQ